MTNGSLQSSKYAYLKTNSQRVLLKIIVTLSVVRLTIISTDYYL